MRRIARLLSLVLTCALSSSALAASRPGVAAAAGGEFAVNSTADGVDADTTDGTCATAAGACSLRAAVLQANASAGADTIVVPAGTYTFASGGGFEDAGLTGDLDITDDLTIAGDGAEATIIQASATRYGGADRLVDILDGAAVAISDVTLRHGYGNGGGAIRTAGALTLMAPVLSYNQATNDGGALYVAAGGTATVSDAVFEFNRTVGYSMGGGMAVHGQATVTDTSFSNNAAGEGGGIANLGTTWVNRATFAGNYGDWGGAVASGSGGIDATHLSLSNVTASDNHAGNRGGGLRHVSGTANVFNSTFVRNIASEGGGISWEPARANAASPILANTLVADNYSATRVTNCDRAVTSFGSNLESADTCGLSATPDDHDLINTSPQITYLGDHGGTLATVALSPGSPAIGGGHSDACPETDARDITRSSPCDIGAYEAAWPLPSPEHVWSFADDFETGESPAINPDADAYGNPGVWTYGSAGASAAVDAMTPATLYVADRGGYEGHEGWQGAGQTHVWKNASAGHIDVGTRSYLRDEAMLHPGSSGEQAIVVWTSPVATIVNVDVALHDRDWSCGNGVSWTLAKKVDGTLTTLSEGVYDNGRSAVATGSQIAVSAGDRLYLAVGARGDYTCDGTQARMIITDLSDTIPPTNPSLTVASPHAPGEWSNDNTIDVGVAGASDATSGVSEFSYEWSSAADTVPDMDADADASATSLPTYAAPEGSSWLHLRTVDQAGNWSHPVHAGPFKIDTVAPGAVTATSTPPINQWTKASSATVTVTPPAADDGSPIEHYLPEWTSTQGDVTYDPGFEGDGLMAPFSLAATETGLVTSPYHYVHVRAVDAAGNLGPMLHYGPFKVDRTAPAVAVPRLALPAQFSKAQTSTSRPKPKVSFTWSGSDAHSDIASYRVNRKTVDANGVATNLSPVSGTKAAYETTSVARGKTYCYTVSSIDKVGNTSAGSQRCAVIPLDDATFSYTGRWAVNKASGYYLGEYLRTAANGATAVTTKVTGNRVHVMYATCSTCGSFKVYAGGVLLTKTAVSTSSSSLVKGVQRSWLLKKALRNAPITVQAVLPKGRELRLEGVGISNAG